MKDKNKGKNDGKGKKSNKTEFLASYTPLSNKEKGTGDSVPDITKKEDFEPAKLVNKLRMTPEEQMLAICKARGYEYKGVISESGGQGVIFKGYQKTLDRYFAVKILKERTLEDRFVLEAKILEKLVGLNTHHICKIIDVHVEEELPPAIIMAYVPGITLHEYMNEHFPKLNESDKQKAYYRLLLGIYRLCDDLSQAHKLGIVHRDLKPGNIMVLNKDSKADMEKRLQDIKFIPDELVLEMLDFGIAKDPDSELTRVDEFFGTPSYVSPEQLGYNLPVDNRTDIYAMGLVLYLVLTGEGFYDKEGMIPDGVKQLQAIFDIMKGENLAGEKNDWKEKRLSLIDEPFRGILRLALQYEKEERFPQIDLLGAMLRSEVEKLRSQFNLPATQTYHALMETTPVSTVWKEKIGQIFSEGEEGDDEASTPEVVEPTSSFTWKWVLYFILLMIMAGIFVFIKLRPDLLKQPGPGKRSSRKIAKKVTKPVMQVVMRSVMQPDGSMKVMKVVVMKPVAMKVPVKPVVVKKPVTPPVVLDFEHFRKECAKLDWQAKDLDAMLKCIMLSLPKMKDVLRKYDAYNQTYMHYCHPGLKRNLRAGKVICGNLENETLKVGYKAADLILKPMREKCMKEKPKYYDENPSSLRVCIKNYAKSVDHHFAQAALVAARLHFLFCKSGPVHKRASVKSCVWSKKAKARLASRLWDQRDAVIRKRLAALKVKAAAKSK